MMEKDQDIKELLERDEEEILERIAASPLARFQQKELDQKESNYATNDTVRSA